MAQQATAEFYRATSQEPLPNIPIPLRAKDRDIVVSLQPLIDDVIRKGRYTHINYQVPLRDPPLSEADEQWMDALLKNAGLRKVPSPADSVNSNGVFPTEQFNGLSVGGIRKFSRITKAVKVCQPISSSVVNAGSHEASGSSRPRKELS